MPPNTANHDLRTRSDGLAESEATDNTYCLTEASNKQNSEIICSRTQKLSGSGVYPGAHLKFMFNCDRGGMRRGAMSLLIVQDIPCTPQFLCLSPFHLTFDPRLNGS